MRARLIAAVLGVALIAAGAVLWLRRGREGGACAGCNLVVISFSNLRKKHLGLYGYERGTTPNLDRFFKDAVRFDNALAPASLTYTLSLSLFYSLYPDTHGLMRRPDLQMTARRLRGGGYQALPQILHDRGYQTAAFVSDEDYAFDYGLGHTFDLYFDRSHYAEHDIVFSPWRYNIGTKHLVDPAIEWLRGRKDQPFFLFLQAYDLHCPYTPDAEMRQRFASGYDGALDESECYMSSGPAEVVEKDGARFFKLQSWFALLERGYREYLLSERDVQHLHDLYDAELAQADMHIGRLLHALEELDLLDDTVVVFLSEHGDYLGENGYFMKAAPDAGGNLHNVNLGFPWLIRHPRWHDAKRFEPLVQTVDVAPTLLDLLGVQHPARSLMEGKSAAASLDSGAAINDYAYAGFVRGLMWPFSMYRLESLQSRDWKIVMEKNLDRADATRYMLYDLAHDPAESRDVAAELPDRLAEMRRRLESYRVAHERSEP
jgi:arylsulfatase A-like enzyme